MTSSSRPPSAGGATALGALGIIQARMGSSRLPGKVLRPLGGRPVLSWVVRAARASGALGDVVVATSDRAADDAIEAACRREDVPCVRGPLDDVLSRFVAALDRHPGDPIVRLTGDCPMLDPAVVRMAVRAFDVDDVDYLSTVTPRSLPRGLDVEIVSAAALRRAADGADGVDRVHVTSYLYTHPEEFRVAGLVFAPPADDLRVTLDTAEDGELLDRVVEVVGDRPVPWRELVSLLRARPDLVAVNAHVRQKRLGEG